MLVSLRVEKSLVAFSSVGGWGFSVSQKSMGVRGENVKQPFFVTSFKHLILPHSEI